MVWLSVPMVSSNSDGRWYIEIKDWFSSMLQSNWIGLCRIIGVAQKVSIIWKRTVHFSVFRKGLIRSFCASKIWRVNIANHLNYNPLWHFLAKGYLVNHRVKNSILINLLNAITTNCIDMFTFFSTNPYLWSKNSTSYQT